METEVHESGQTTPGFENSLYLKSARQNIGCIIEFHFSTNFPKSPPAVSILEESAHSIQEDAEEQQKVVP